MKKKLAAFFVLILLIVSCGNLSQKSDKVILPIKTLVSTPIALPSQSYERSAENYFPNLTPIPTLSISQQSDLIFLLKSNACNLPCYLDIEPGKTTFDEVENISSKLGGTLRTDYVNFYEGYPEREPLRWRSYIFDIDSLFYINMNISGKENQIQQIVVDSLSNSEALFYEAWAKYSIESIFKIYGEPDQILVYLYNSYNVKSYTIRVIYLNYGMVLDWSGTLNDISLDSKLCPKFSKENIVNLQIILVDPKAAFKDIPSSFMGFDEMWSSVDDTLGISKKEFYETIIINPDMCFKVKTVSD